MHYDDMSLSSYGSHQHRNFASASPHKGSLDLLAGPGPIDPLEPFEKQTNPNGRPVRQVVIDEDRVEARSISEEDSEAAQARLEAEILEATTQELMMQVIKRALSANIMASILSALGISF